MLRRRFDRRRRMMERIEQRRDDAHMQQNDACGTDKFACRKRFHRNDTPHARDRNSRISPGWHSSTPQIFSNVEKRTPLTFARFEQGKIGFRDVDRLRKFLRAHLAPRHHHVEIDDDRHQTNFVFSSAARCASAITREITKTTPAVNNDDTSPEPKSSDISRCPWPRCQLNSNDIGA